MATEGTSRRGFLRNLGGATAEGVLIGRGGETTVAAMTAATPGAAISGKAGGATKRSPGSLSPGTCDNCDSVCSNCPMGCCLSLDDPLPKPERPPR